MPLINSVFRIIKREPTDPHGVEGYFVHELYVRHDGTVSGWRAGVSLGGKDLDTLKNHMTRMIEAFYYDPIPYQSLLDKSFRVYLSSQEENRFQVHFKQSEGMKYVFGKNDNLSGIAPDDRAGVPQLPLERPEGPDSATPGSGSVSGDVDRSEPGDHGG